MTGLGAAIYLGFFALAALWLFITPEGPIQPDDQDQRPERSNSTSTSAEELTTDDAFTESVGDHLGQ